ncbi:sensor domain-containing diguanylate cyclase [Chitinasiproducens palmae]|uniref:Diguanylate cyclase (GGDEF) domain-containing protein n=1 Tax=Chitinasiproducens palmae TaxID=1770053 RepID=A0A1H2PQJ0_9BURK|nr:diguanylate cyclase [Chitinasiproducens palmae]SDV48664.1 diguanylate cyclase (GGDEF) domain-containing protein [Chitinasiproducens palmae]
MQPPVPPNEPQRIEVLEQYGILDTPPEERYENIVDLAVALSGAPIALVSLVAADRQWFKAKVGLDVCETPRNISFCAYAIAQPDEPMVIADASHDPRFANNPLVTGPRHVRAYAGVPLVTDGGLALGTLCVLDTEPRAFSAKQIDALRKLASQVVALLDLRRGMSRLESLRLRFESFMNAGPFLAYIKDSDWRFVYVNRPFLQRFGLHADQVIGSSDFDLWPESAPAFRRSDEAIRDSTQSQNFVEVLDAHPEDKLYWRSYKFPLSIEEHFYLGGVSVDITETQRQRKQLEDYQSRLEEAVEELRLSSLTDSLTRTGNRRAFDAQLTKHVEQAGHLGRPLSLLVLDVDHFKSFNDTFGHQAGDEALSAVAAKLRTSCGDGIGVFRYGGEEFALILPDADAATALVVGEHCRQAIALTPWPLRPLTISIGTATLRASDTPTALLRRADAALYRAKETGRDRVVGG